MASTSVLDPLVRVQKVVSNLRAKSNTCFILIFYSIFGFTFFFFGAGHASTQHLPGRGAVLMLTAFALALCNRSSRQVRQTNRAAGLVYVLTTCAAGAKNVFANIALFNFNFGVLGNLR